AGGGERRVGRKGPPEAVGPGPVEDPLPAVADQGDEAVPRKLVPDPGDPADPDATHRFFVTAWKSDYQAPGATSSVLERLEAGDLGHQPLRRDPGRLAQLQALQVVERDRLPVMDAEGMEPPH